MATLLRVSIRSTPCLRPTTTRTCSKQAVYNAVRAIRLITLSHAHPLPRPCSKPASRRVSFPVDVTITFRSAV